MIRMFTRRHKRAGGFTLAAAVTIALSSAAHAQCGDTVRVEAGDTLSTIADRCNVSEARILDLNPTIEGSKDLRAGMTLDLAPPAASETAARTKNAAESFLGRLKGYAREAGQTLEGAAETLGRSVEDFVKSNPDLHQRVRKLGQRLDIPGMEKVEAQVSLSVRRGAPGTPVTLSAIGLPPNQRVEIAGGAPDGDYEIIETARTSADGTLQVTVELPRRADPQRDFIFVIASPTINVAVRSATFDVEEAAAADAGPK